jgi:NAD(P)-dependent dehydrogenase (short-subunit alcohol dehydrogenase family)
MPRRAEAGAGVADVDLAGTTVLLTGATDGIGREAALSLGRLGATVLVHGRDAGKGRAVVDGVREAGGEADLLTADFASLDAVRDLARAVADRVDELDVLANNAGAYFAEGRTTGDGFERTIQVNHLAPFLLTHELYGTLAPGARVVTTASDAHRAGEPSFEFRSVEGYSGFGAYARSKLANVLFARELAARLDGGRTANSFHPGTIPGTAVWREAPAYLRLPIRLFGAIPYDPWTTSVVEGAETLVYLAAAPEVAGVSGEYFADCAPELPSDAAADGATQRELWTRSADALGVDPAAIGGTEAAPDR